MEFVKTGRSQDSAISAECCDDVNLVCHIGTRVGSIDRKVKAFFQRLGDPWFEHEVDFRVFIAKVR